MTRNPLYTMSNVRWDDNEISNCITRIRQGAIRWVVFDYDNKPLKVSTLKYDGTYIRIKQNGRDPKAFINALSSTESNLGYVKGETSDIFVQSVPDSVDNMTRVFCLLHSKKLQRVINFNIRNTLMRLKKC